MIDAARTRQVARLVESSLTAEGDPIITKYATNQLGRMAVLIDTRQDRFGPHTLDLQTYRTSEQNGSAIAVTDRVGHAQLWPLQGGSSWLRELGILYPLRVERQCGLGSMIDRPELAGLPLPSVQKTEREAGRSVRIIGQDGTCSSITYDFSSNRTNVYVENGSVTWAEMA